MIVYVNFTKGGSNFLDSSVELVYVARLLIASFCGLLIGTERQTRMKGAGMKTHMMVALGSALMMLVSKYGFFDAIMVESASVDVSRVAASIAGGIGFLGAGVIFVKRGSVVGLTTAAGLWATTGVGMAIGSGMYIIGIMSTVLMVLSQLLLHYIERTKSVVLASVQLTVNDDPAAIPAIQDWLSTQSVRIKEVHTGMEDEHLMGISIAVVLPHGYDKGNFLRMQSDIPYIESIEV